MIVVVGEALVDLVLEPDGNLSAALGGAPFNTARAAARLGSQVAFDGRLSTDRFGTMLAEQLVADGVSLGATRTDLPTTLAAAELDASGAAEYRFYFEGTSAPALTKSDISTAVPGSRSVLFTGGLALVLAPMADTVADFVAEQRTAHGSDVLVVVDANCRPAVIADRDAYTARLDGVMSHADIVKASDEDLAYLAPGIPTIDAARALLGQGPRFVLVTSGAASTSIVHDGGVVTIPVPSLAEPVVDTIGAGDTFGGAVCAWLDRANVAWGDLDVGHVERAVTAGHAAAAVVVTRRGADPPVASDLAVWPAP